MILITVVAELCNGGTTSRKAIRPPRRFHGWAPARGPTTKAAGHGLKTERARAFARTLWLFSLQSRYCRDYGVVSVMFVFVVVEKPSFAAFTPTARTDLAPAAPNVVPGVQLIE